MPWTRTPRTSFSAPRGQALDHSNFAKTALTPAWKAAGIERLTCPDLRHTAASLAVQAGGSVKAVQTMLSHASSAMTLDTYAGLFDTDAQALADRMDEARRKAPSASAAHLMPTASKQVTPIIRKSPA